MILQNKVEVIVQQNELLWKTIFGLTTEGVEQEKEQDIVTIEDDQSNKEGLGMSSSKGNISPIHATTPDTLVI